MERPTSLFDVVHASVSDTVPVTVKVVEDVEKIPWELSGRRLEREVTV
jgi:hypothetical protein